MKRPPMIWSAGPLPGLAKFYFPAYLLCHDGYAVLDFQMRNLAKAQFLAVPDEGHPSRIKRQVRLTAGSQLFVRLYLHRLHQILQTSF